MIQISSVGFAFLATTIAGLATGIGSLIAYIIKKPKMSHLSFGLGLSGGVMIYISFMELLPQGIAALGEIYGVILFFIGMVFIGVIDFALPEVENPHHPVEYPEILNGKENGKENGKKIDQTRLMKTGVLTAIAIGIHNFPEGLAAFGTTLSDAKLGIFITIAIAIHNIPEGISVSIPIYFATKSKKKAFYYSFLSGLSEPIGAFIGYLILRPFLSDELIGGLLAFISGIMVYISMDELLPTAHHYGHGHQVIIGFVLGMGVMALSLLLF